MRHTGEMADLKTQLDRLQREKAAAEQAARQMQVELEQIRSTGGPMPVPARSAPATVSSRRCGC